MNKEAIDFIINRLVAGERNLDLIKREASKKYKVPMIKNPDILSCFPEDKITPQIKSILIKKPAKTLSGVTPIAVMIKPENSCKHKCIYCPSSDLAAKSYVGFEPAALRGRQFNFDPYRQTLSRIKQLASAGHETDKCEVIVMGGTFLEMDSGYKESFIKGIYDAINGRKSKTLDEAKKINQKASRRVIGLTIETRPDCCIPYIDEILSFGATRVELGVQIPDDAIYKLINRGHTVDDVVNATKEMKNSAFKVLYHIMPGLPGSNKQKDIGFVKELFSNSRFQPDMLKIYPTLVIDRTPLADMMKRGQYIPYMTEEAVDVISEFYRHVPKYVRIMRIQRDIPAPKINRGVKKSNLRELVEESIREKGIIPQEIRYREIRNNASATKPDAFVLEQLEYMASEAKEVFLSYENEDNQIAAFLRLRLPKETKESKQKEINESAGRCALVRELHVYGPEVRLKGKGNIQHRGLGLNLLKEAERIAKCDGRDKMIIISGVGVREYYVKHGYSLLGAYMKKDL